MFLKISKAGSDDMYVEVTQEQMERWCPKIALTSELVENGNRSWVCWNTIEWPYIDIVASKDRDKLELL